MSIEDFKAMMDELIAEEEERLGIGTEEFKERHKETVKRHEEIMEMIERIRKEDEQQKMTKQFVNVKDVMEVCNVSKSAAYGIIRQLNNELKAQNFITIPGKIPKAYFEEKCYGVHISG